MCSQLALLIKKILDDIIGTQQSACEATLQYQYQHIHFSLMYALFAECSIDTIKAMCILQSSPNIYKEAGKLSVHYATFLASLPYSCSVHKRAE